MWMVADFEVQYHFPTCPSYTDLQPDLVVYSDLTKTAILVELTVCFECNFEDPKSRKEADLVNKIEGNDFTVDLITVEVGTHGFVQYENFHHLNELLGTTQKVLTSLLVDATIKNSFRIWTQRNCWSDPNENTDLD